MRILVACEQSQVVTKQFRDLGFECYSCDISEPKENKSWHIKDDVLNIINDNWDMMIAHPPCTHLCSSGARWFKEKIEDGRQQLAINFFMALVNAPIHHICIENPIGIMSTVYRKPDQIIQPWMFGHGETKATCLWLKNLPKLIPTNIVQGREPRIHKMPPSKDRGFLRSITYTGIAKAMSEQWT